MIKNGIALAIFTTVLFATLGCASQQEAVIPKATAKQFFNDAPIESVTLNYTVNEVEKIKYVLDVEEIARFLAFLDKHKDKLIEMQIPSPPAYYFTIVTNKEKYTATYSANLEGVFLNEKNHGWLPDTQVRELAAVLEFIEERHRK